MFNFIEEYFFTIVFLQSLSYDYVFCLDIAAGLVNAPGFIEKIESFGNVWTIHKPTAQSKSNTQPGSFRIRINCRKMALSKIIGRFNIQAAKGINILRDTWSQPIRQRNCYEYIVRNQKAYLKIVNCIIINPLK